MGNYEVLARRFAEANLRVEVIERQIQSVSRWSSGASASDVFQMTILGHRREEFFRMWPGARTNRVEAEGIDRDRGQLVLMVHEPERTFEERLPKRRVNPDPAKVTVVREDKLWPKALPRHLRFHDLRGTTATLLARAGVPLVVAQRMLRHADPRLTANVYTRVVLGDLRAGVARLPPLGPSKSRFLRCRVAMQPRRGDGCNPGVFQWR